MTADRESGFVTGLDAQGLEFDLRADAVIGLHERTTSACPGTPRHATIHTANGRIETRESIADVRAAVRNCLRPEHGPSGLKDAFLPWSIRERIKETFPMMSVGVDLAEPRTERTVVTRITAPSGTEDASFGCSIPVPDSEQRPRETLGEPQRSHEVRLVRVLTWNLPVAPKAAQGVLIAIANRIPAPTIRDSYGLTPKQFRRVYDLVGHSARDLRRITTASGRLRFLNGLMQHWERRVAAAQDETKVAA